jgi:hypothetical protein
VPTREAGHDVQRHAQQGDPAGGQEVHDERTAPFCPREFEAQDQNDASPTATKQKPLEIYVDDETKLTLHGLQQHYIKLQESEKNRKLNDLLDNLEFNQVVIFVKSIPRANELNRLLVECNFPSICIHSGMAQEERYSHHFLLGSASDQRDA